MSDSSLGPEALSARGGDHIPRVTAHEKTMLQRQITATDHQINHIVYALYGLTSEEIQIVEGSTP